jgi:hypothetical protein
MEQCCVLFEVRTEVKYYLGLEELRLVGSLLYDALSVSRLYNVDHRISE